MREGLKNKIDYSIDLIRKCESMALQYDAENGFALAFSGGKDSQVLYHIAKMAGVKFKAHMCLTSVDPGEVIRFVKRCYPDVLLIKPKMSIYSMAKKKGVLPTRRMRWCCQEYKEFAGAGKVTLIGIRKEESSRRSKREEIATTDRKFSGNLDQFNIYQETTITCVGGKDGILVSPIIYWTEKDVWEFLNEYNIEHCSLYDKGRTRIGCILCPMASTKNKNRDIKEFPHVVQKWKETIQWLHDNKCKDYNLNINEAFNWWISGNSFAQFYADEIQQQKIDFGNEHSNI